MSDQQVAAIKAVIKDMLAESNTHFTITGLKSREQLAALLQHYTPDEKLFTPLELFFIIETSPEPEMISPVALQEAYCAALKQLNAEWWGVPSSTEATVVQHLLQVPGISTCLAALLPDTTPLGYLHGEENTLANQLQWQRGDLAAGLLSVIHGKEYDFRAPLQERKKAREAWRKK